MTRRLTVLAAVVAAAALAAPVALAGAPPTIKADRRIVGFDLPAGDFIKGTPRGQSIRNPKGFEVDLANAVAKQLGIPTVQWLRVKFGKLFTAGRKSYDFAFEQVTITAERDKTIDFSAPYFDANQGVLMAKAATVPRSKADLKNMKWCAQKTTTGEFYLDTRVKPTQEISRFDDLAPAFTAVQNGACDAVMMDIPIIYGEKKQRPDSYGPIAGQVITNERYGAVLQQGSALKAHLDRALRALKANGTVGRLQKKWFNVNFATVPVLK
jgi:polar amino acid transport system substrate-binding protein